MEKIKVIVEVVDNGFFIYSDPPLKTYVTQREDAILAMIRKVFDDHKAKPPPSGVKLK